MAEPRRTLVPPAVTEFLGSARFTSTLALLAVVAGFSTHAIRALIGWPGLIGVLGTITVLAALSFIATPWARMKSTEFVERFERLYTADDVERFLALFSPGARGNKGNYADLAGDYRRLFEQRRHRRLSLSDLRWEIDGDRAAGNGRYAAWVGPGVGKPESHTHGQILLQLTRDAHGLRITRLHHTVSP